LNYREVYRVESGTVLLFILIKSGLRALSFVAGTFVVALEDAPGVRQEIIEKKKTIARNLTI
jgi:hypothetical protein